MYHFTKVPNLKLFRAVPLENRKNIHVAQKNMSVCNMKLFLDKNNFIQLLIFFF